MNDSIKHQPLPSLRFLSLPVLSLSACSLHPRFFFFNMCVLIVFVHVIYAVRVYLHSTRLCGSYYRQVSLKDRRTFPLWFRYSK